MNKGRQRVLKTKLSHNGRQKSGRQTHAKQNIFKICKLFKRLTDVILDNNCTQHFIKTYMSKVVHGKNRFFTIGSFKFCATKCKTQWST